MLGLRNWSRYPQFPLLKHSPSKRLEVGKYASQNGSFNNVLKFQNEFPKFILSENLKRNMSNCETEKANSPKKTLKL